jgi:predicted O-methyltransferase YrrM
MRVMEDTWAQIDTWLGDAVGDGDDSLERTLADSDAAGMPAIAVSRVAGKFLHLIVRLRGARRILEVGTLGGYSTIWMARGLPVDGRLVTLEINEKHAAVAKRNIDGAGLSSRVEIITGSASDTLARMREKRVEPFDVVFIDADKRSSDVYFDHALGLTVPGSVIIVDNVVRKGAVLDASTEDPDLRGIQRMMERIRTEPRVTATALQTVGSKGHDGFLLALVNTV